LELWSSLHQKVTLTFLQTYPTPQTAMAASQEQIEATLKQAKHPHASQAAVQIFEQLHQPHLTADEITTRTKSRLLQVLLKQLQPLVEEIANYDKEIQRLFLTHADSPRFQSLPPAGKQLAPRRLPEIGDDRSRYASAARVIALAGTSPVLFQSGTYAKAHRRSACIKPRLFAMQQLAWQSTLSEAWALDYYRRKRAEGKSHSVALRALANVWARILYALERDEQEYQTETFEAAQRAHGRRVA
jgi:hypothetical protein